MNINQMRQWVYDHFKAERASPLWLSKIHRMPDRQVIAIYKRLQK